jgi:CRP-like cAMP-binding protein
MARFFAAAEIAAKRPPAVRRLASGTLFAPFSASGRSSSLPGWDNNRLTPSTLRKGHMSFTATPNQSGNRLLDRLPKNEYESLIRSEKSIRLAHGDDVDQENSRGGLSHVYFPTSGMVSLTVLMENGKEVEAGTIGSEGMIGLSVAQGLDFSPTKAICQISGEGLRIPVAAFLKAMKQPDGTLDKLMRRFTAYSLRYANQTIACNLLHSAKQRICRWLLMCRDRVETDEFTLTHQFLAEMLGVRRQTVTVIAGKLQAAKLITYRRGVIHILNRKRLEAASCECYEVTKAFYDRIMK